jgi:hypothetical protein
MEKDNKTATPIRPPRKKSPRKASTAKPKVTKEVGLHGTELTVETHGELAPYEGPVAGGNKYEPKRKVGADMPIRPKGTKVTKVGLGNLTVEHIDPPDYNAHY